MSDGALLPALRLQGFDATGQPLANGLLYSYAAGGTTTPQATFSDAALTTTNANPTSLDPAGRAVVFLGPFPYNLVLTNAAGVQQYAQDNVRGATLDVRGVSNGRLTGVSGSPVADATAITTLYFAPYLGNLLALYNGVVWSVVTFAQASLSLAGYAANTNFDVFGYASGATVALETVAWTNGTTRATGLTTQDGVSVKSGAPTRRYLGTIRTTGTVGQTQDDASKRFIWNAQNRLKRSLAAADATDSWTYTSPTYRQANGSALNQVEAVIGLAECSVSLRLLAFARNTTAGANIGVSIGQDSATTPVAGVLGMLGVTKVANIPADMEALFDALPTVGYHFYTWLEQSEASGITTWLGDNGNPNKAQSGLTGTVEA